jgi:hypothetical protein
MSSIVLIPFFGDAATRVLTAVLAHFTSSLSRSNLVVGLILLNDGSTTLKSRLLLWNILANLDGWQNSNASRNHQLLLMSYTHTHTQTSLPITASPFPYREHSKLAKTKLSSLRRHYSLSQPIPLHLHRSCGL